MDIAIATFIPDESQDYGEARLIAIGFIGLNLYVLVFTEVAEHLYTIRAVSLRKAEPGEERFYAEDN